MKPEWKFAAFGGLGGAALAIAVVFIAAETGFLPVRESVIHDYLMAHPAIIFEMRDKVQAAQADEDARAEQKAVEKLGLKPFFDSSVAFTTGPIDAKKSLVEFFDYNCPHCRASLPALKRFYEVHKNDTRFAFVEYPFEGPDSTLAARASIAARNQPDKYIPFYFALMGSEYAANAEMIKEEAEKVGIDLAKLQRDMDAPGVEAAITKAHALADAAKLDGTPFFIINGKVHSGEVNDADLKQLSRN